MVVATTPVGSVYLRDIAEVSDAHKENFTLSRLNGENSIALAIQKQSDANSVKTSDRCSRETMALLERRTGGRVTFTVAQDITEFTRNSLYGVSSATWASRSSWWHRAVPVPAQRPELADRPALDPDIAHHHVLLHVPAGLHAEPGLPDGPRSGDRYSGGRLDCRAGEHSPASGARGGAGQAAIKGRSEIGFAAIAITLVDVVVFLPISSGGGHGRAHLRRVRDHHRRLHACCRCSSLSR